MINTSKDSKIYWGNLSTVSYQYGSTIKKLAFDHIYFKNPLIPSSQVIKEWRSSTSFQGERQTPSLRLLKQGASYKLKIKLSSFPEDTVLVELVFKNRFGEIIENIATKEQELFFVFPKGAYDYSIRLLSAGLEEFDFYYLEIVDDEEQIEV